MQGTLYVIGVGPGDPELLTLKAVRILNAVPCLCVPRGREEGSSLAMSIVEGVVDLKSKDIIEAFFPMKKTGASDLRHGKSVTADDELEGRWNETVLNILKRLNQGIDVAFITIGDPTIYSTFFYLHDRLVSLAPGMRIEIVPGVSSINAAAARAGISLGLADEKIAVLPATYAGDLKDILSGFDTVVLMKVYRVFDEVVRNLTTAGLVSKAVYISKAGMREEAIIRDLKDVRQNDLNYFSVIIIRRTAKS
ncbi:MAG TPA: precorrin-2 C(20)-methyltransferase [Dissulfurispiraceae bacterium]|nr:precorrin-2 C(20)-methyltransferase [Dissulfurispiraceae bacterium]